MGAEISITNRSHVPLHISLWHISPLHYGNTIQPGETFHTGTGKVWFTISARIATGTNEYTTADNTWRIGGAVVGSLSLVGTAGSLALTEVGVATAGAVGLTRAGSTLATVQRIVTWSGLAATTYQLAGKLLETDDMEEIIGGVVGQPGVVVHRVGPTLRIATDECHEKEVLAKISEWTTKGCLNSPGWLITGRRCLEIRGGPDAFISDGRVIIDGRKMEPFELVEVTEGMITHEKEA